MARVRRRRHFDLYRTMPAVVRHAYGLSAKVVGEAPF
jgi:hypothetical protein